MSGVAQASLDLVLAYVKRFANDFGRHYRGCCVFDLVCAQQAELY